jgi:hypothetical protein
MQVTANFDKWQKHWAYSQCCTKWVTKEYYSADISRSRNITRKDSQYSSQTFEQLFSAFAHQSVVKRTMPSIWWLWSILHIPRPSHRPTLQWLKIFWKDNNSLILKKSLKKWQKHDRVIKKWFWRMLPKGLQRLAKGCHCPRELIWRKSYVERSKVTYFCIINKFPELLKLLA